MLHIADDLEDPLLQDSASLDSLAIQLAKGKFTKKLVLQVTGRYTIVVICKYVWLHILSIKYLSSMSRLLMQISYSIGMVLKENDSDTKSQVWARAMNNTFFRTRHFVDHCTVPTPVLIHVTSMSATPLYMEHNGLMHSSLNIHQAAESVEKPTSNHPDCIHCSLPPGKSRTRWLNMSPLPKGHGPRQTVPWTKAQVAKFGTKHNHSDPSQLEQLDDRYKSVGSECNCCTRDKDGKRGPPKRYPAGRRKYFPFYGPDPQVRSNGLRKLDAAIVRHKARKETSWRRSQVYIRSMFTTHKQPQIIINTYQHSSSLRKTSQLRNHLLRKFKATRCGN
jgi:hypothetical protein